MFGIDCGTETTGFGVVESDDSGRTPRLVLKAMGAIRLKKTLTTAERLLRVFRDLSAELERWTPDAVAIEEVFYSVNARSALKLGQVRGVALLAAAAQGLPVAEYAPLKIKSSVVGYGLAKKEQVQFMVARLSSWPEVAGVRGCCGCIGNCHLSHPYGADACAAGGGAMRLRALGWWLALALAGLPARGWTAEAPEFQVDYSNPGLTPSHWTLTLHPDGSGHFHSDRRSAAAGESTASGMESSDAIRTPDVDRDVKLSGEFAQYVFETARRHNLLTTDCESHLKVAFQGWKKLSYSGPEGAGGCEFNYSKDKEIQALGDSLVAVAGTILEGARLEVLLQHDRLGLDHEMEYVTEASKDGRLQEIGAIRGILDRLADDPDVMVRVRRLARTMVSGKGK